MIDAIARKIEELDRLRTRPDARQVPAEEGRFLYQLALTSGAKRILEVGMSYGFSGLHWGAALLQNGGTLDTIDADEKKVAAATAAFADAGLSQTITVHHGRAIDVLNKLTGPFDIVFLDADRKGEPDYVRLVWPKVRPGGSVLADNVLTHPQEMVDYLRHVRSIPGASSITVPIGNGVEWTVKRKD